jgi:hypothetical protein
LRRLAAAAQQPAACELYGVVARVDTQGEAVLLAAAAVFAGAISARLNAPGYCGTTAASFLLYHSVCRRYAGRFADETLTLLQTWRRGFPAGAGKPNRSPGGAKALEAPTLFIATLE